MNNKNKGLIIVISGPSGVGKGTLIKELRSRRDYGFSVSHTTRYMRPGEQDGVDYHFVTREQFQQLVEAGKMLEHAEYNGNCYGTSYAAVMETVERGKDIILDIEVVGGSNVKKSCPEAVEIFLLPPSMEELERRLRGRGTENDATILGRLTRAREEILYAPHYDYIVVDRTPVQAADEIEEIINAIKRGSAFQAALADKLLSGGEI
ncbi:MAG: guanylate kinase [Oscillospiraceae bacterium]|nr:guanylate kinase [Oscillospiraceae bacterium]